MLNISFAQNASINIYSSTVNITSSATISVAGDIIFGAGGSIDNSGTIRLGGNWNNTSGNGLINGSLGTVNFVGVSPTVASQKVSGTTTFYNLTLSNTNDTTDFGSSKCYISNTLSASAGFMKAGTSTIDFIGSACTISGGNSKRFYYFRDSVGASVSVANTTGNNIHIFKSFVNNGTFKVLGSRVTVYFDSAGTAETISGSPVSTIFRNVTVGSTAITGSPPATSLTASSDFTIDSATLNFYKASTYTGSNNTVTFSRTCAIKDNSTAGVAIAKFYNAISTGGGIDFSTVSTINATFTINSGGFVSNNDPPKYASGSTLKYNTGGNFGRSSEWSAIGTVGTTAGYPYNVQISTSGTLLNLGNGGAGTARQCAGALTIDASTTLTMATTPMSATLTVLGNVTNNGTLVLSSTSGGDLILGGNWANNGTFTPNSRDVSFKGSSAQTLTKNGGVGSTETFASLDINNTSGGVTLNSTPITVTAQLRLLSGILFAGGNLVTVSSNASNAIIDYDSIPSVSAYYTSSWVNGTLKRSAQVGGTYYFPIGTSSYYELLRFAPIGGSGLTDLTTSFTSPSCGTISTEMAADTPYINKTQVNTALDYGYWTVSPNGTYTTPKYNLAIYETGYNNCGSFQPAIKDSAYGIVKRTNSSFAWTGTFFGSIGYHHNSLQQQYNPSGTLWCFKAVRDSVPSFSDYAIGYNGQDIALPLQLVAFDAGYENNLVHLNWITESELNTDHFEVERSEDGLQFENIAREEAAHHSIYTLNYSYDDRNAAALHTSPLYYRLRMVDEDSTATYSMVRSVQLPFSASLQVQASPNPFSDHLVLNVVSSKVQPAQITISNEQGIVILTAADVSLQAGKNTFEFSSLEHLTPAVYFLRLATEASTITQKIVKE